MKRTRWMWLIVGLVTAALAACGGAGEDASSDTPPVSEGGEGREAFLGSCTPSGPLRLFNWGEYLDPAIREQFQAVYGVEVTEDNYGSNEELITKLRAGNSGYDLVFPSDYAVAQMAEEGLLAELERENIPNIENVNPELMGLYYDPDNRYSLPYQWGVTGISYNEAYFETAPDSYALIFDASVAGQQEGSFSVLDDERETIGAALKFLGYSVNDSDPAHVAEAEALLLEQKQLSNFSGYNSENFYDALAGEEVVFAHAWSGGTALAASENEAIRFTVPQEGGVIWQDNMAVPADAPNRCTAELFINYILHPEIAAQLVSFTYYNTPVLAALDLVDEETRALLDIVAVDEATMDRLEWIERTEGSSVFSDAWTRVKSR